MSLRKYKVSPEAVKMIIKFNCHSSFRVDGKHYLLKFIWRRARIRFSKKGKKHTWDWDHKWIHVAQVWRWNTQATFIILTRMFVHNIPVDLVTFLWKPAVSISWILNANSSMQLYGVSNFTKLCVCFPCQDEGLGDCAEKRRPCFLLQVQT